MKFNYKKLFADIEATFVFGDTFKGKAEEIGCTYGDLYRMKNGEPDSMALALKGLEYLVKYFRYESIKEAFGYYLDPALVDVPGFYDLGEEEAV